jgi:hypothetical protein
VGCVSIHSRLKRVREGWVLIDYGMSELGTSELKVHVVSKVQATNETNSSNGNGTHLICFHEVCFHKVNVIRVSLIFFLFVFLCSVHILRLFTPFNAV